MGPRARDEGGGGNSTNQKGKLFTANLVCQAYIWNVLYMGSPCSFGSDGVNYVVHAIDVTRGDELVTT
jgi:hypothetical protein